MRVLKTIEELRFEGIRVYSAQLLEELYTEAREPGRLRTANNWRRLSTVLGDAFSWATMPQGDHYWMILQSYLIDRSAGRPIERGAEQWRTFPDEFIRTFTKELYNDAKFDEDDDE